MMQKNDQGQPDKITPESLREEGAGAEAAANAGKTASQDKPTPARQLRTIIPDPATGAIEWVECIASAVILVVLLSTFVFRLITVDGASMMNTLQDGNRVVISHLFYQPAQDDIVVFSTHVDGNQTFIKRIIATEGQTVDIDYESDTIYIDGVPYADGHAAQDMYAIGDIAFPVTVPDGCVFVMGDNRNHSKDSRFSDVGMIATDQILGRLIVRIYPFDVLGAVA